MFLALAWFFILLRIWTRTWIIASFGWDDAAMILACVRPADQTDCVPLADQGVDDIHSVFGIIAIHCRQRRRDACHKP